MKKTILFIAAIVMAAVSCNKENAPEPGDNPSVTGKLTATIVQTKVSYTETSSLNLQPAWEVGDKIIGFDDAGNTYTLSVASVSAQTATLEGALPDGDFHLIYKSGAKASDIANKTLAIDYTNQAGDKTMPAVMLADGTVEDGACDFAFVNAGAIIGISAVKGAPEGSTISKITIEGENLSAATVALSGNSLVLTAAAKSDDEASTATLSGSTVLNSSSGKLSTTIFIAVPAGAKISKVIANVTKEPETNTKPSATPQEGIDYVTIAGIKWAKWNLGATSESDYGWYFHWGDTCGHIIKSDRCISAGTTDEYSYSLSSVKTAGAGDYLYVSWPSFRAYSFDWAHAPFNNGSADYNETYIKNVIDTVCPDNVLASEYDAVKVNWGGNWRMPDSEEIRALADKKAVKSEWISNYNGTGINGCLVTSMVPGEEGHSIFLPAGGFGSYEQVVFENENGTYWSSSYTFDGVSNIYLQNAFRLGFSSTTLFGGGTANRKSGCLIRPVLDY